MSTAERNTRQRDAIKAALESAQRPLSTQEILEAANAQVQGLGIATIYRNLKSFLQSGEIAQVSMPGDSPRYELSGHGHHHHFHCTRCDRLFDVHQCPGDLKNLAPQGFTVERHELTLYGVCADCKNHPTQTPDHARQPAA